MVMKRELYLEVGGFDEDCFMYLDDIDLSYMVLQRNEIHYFFMRLQSFTTKAKAQ